jgi:RNA polymerase sigma factor (sigma-70 family)
VDAQSEALPAGAAAESRSDLERLFHTHYARLSRVLARVVHDHARAEELAVEVFLRWSTRGHGPDERAAGWLYRTAVRIGLDELRRQARRQRFERLTAGLRDSPPTPEEVHAAKEEQRRVRAVLARLRTREVELLVLRSHGFSYEELAATLGLNPLSMGTLLGRAQRAFRREYESHHGHQ